MSSDPRRRDVFINICALPENQLKCQEEIRIDDYIKAYTTTGRPPAPVTQEPAGEAARAALGLPPLFQPFVEPLTPTSITPVPTISGQPSSSSVTKDPTKLPGIHAFQPVVDGETYYSLSAIPEYSFFSHDELRYYAYAAGIIFPPTPLPLDLPPITLSASSSTRVASTAPASPAPLPPFFAKDTQATAFFDEPDVSGQGTLYYHSMSAARRYNKHSVEELRIAFLHAGRQLDSSEISPSPPAIATAAILSSTGTSGTAFGSSLFGSTGSGGAFAHSPVVRPF